MPAYSTGGPPVSNYCCMWNHAIRAIHKQSQAGQSEMARASPPNFPSVIWCRNIVTKSYSILIYNVQQRYSIYMVSGVDPPQMRPSLAAEHLAGHDDERWWKGDRYTMWMKGKEETKKNITTTQSFSCFIYPLSLSYIWAFCSASDWSRPKSFENHAVWKINENEKIRLDSISMVFSSFARELGLWYVRASSKWVGKWWPMPLFETTCVNAGCA